MTNSLFLRYEWCKWSSWSQCTADTCTSGIQEAGFQQSSDEDPWDFCVVPLNADSSSSRYALVQTAQSGTVKRRPAQKFKYRECTCTSVSINNFLPFKRKSCEHRQIQFTCAQCSNDEAVYFERHAKPDDPTLPTCSADQRFSQLYQILVYIFVGVAIVVLLFWLIRCIYSRLAGSSSSRSRSTRLGLDRSFGMRDSTRPPSRAPMTATSDNSDLRGDQLPPAYKDVVSDSHVIFIDPSRPQTVPGGSQANVSDFNKSIQNVDNVNRVDNQASAPGDESSTPPPPKYGDVIRAAGRQETAIEMAVFRPHSANADDGEIERTQTE